MFPSPLDKGGSRGVARYGCVQRAAAYAVREFSGKSERLPVEAFRGVSVARRGHVSRMVRPFNQSDPTFTGFIGIYRRGTARGVRRFLDAWLTRKSSSKGRVTAWEDLHANDGHVVAGLV